MSTDIAKECLTCIPCQRVETYLNSGRDKDSYVMQLAKSVQVVHLFQDHHLSPFEILMITGVWYKPEN